MRRVVVTGMGIVSPIGNNVGEVLEALKAGRSGIERSEEMAEHGFRSRVAGTIKLDPAAHIEKRKLRFMGPGAAYAYLAMEQAIADAGLTEGEVSHERTGLIAGSAPLFHVSWKRKKRLAKFLEHLPDTLDLMSR